MENDSEDKSEWFIGIRNHIIVHKCIYKDVQRNCKIFLRIINTIPVSRYR